MMSAPMGRRREASGWVYLGIVLFWSGAFGTDLLSFAIDPQYEALGVDWGVFGLKHAMIACFWMATTFVALGWYAERPMFERGAVRGSAAVVAVAAVTAIVFSGYFVGLLYVLTDGEIEPEGALAIVKSHTLLYGFLTSLEIGVATNVYHGYRRSRRKQRSSEQLRAKLAETELALLRAQLEPHFLFNALNSISALVSLGHNERATEALSQLAALLRGMLEVGQRKLMSWEWEEGFTRNYIKLQKLRFEDRLDVDIHADGIASDAELPACLLQPLIENAIRHGPLDDGERCRVSITLRSDAGRLQLVVTSPLARSTDHRGTGVGLSNIEARLRAVYADDFELTRGPRAGDFVVAASMPAVYGRPM
jgi:hypothetical protein